MRTYRLALFAGLLLCPSFPASATVHYVDAGNASPIPPYASWPTAARVIQDAVEVSSDGDLILVTNGVYQTGGHAITGEITGNRVALTKAVSLQSVNGPAVTVIRGYPVPGTTNGPGAIRCAYLTNGASLVGFTLANGATAATSYQSDLQGPHEMGGGAACRFVDAVVSNCFVVGNTAYQGGGAAHGTWINCVFSNNVAVFGGGAFNGAFANCLFVGNRGETGGGAELIGDAPGVAFNCTIWGNSATTNGGGILFGSFLQPATVYAYNCIILGNSAPSGGNYSSAGGLVGFGAVNCCVEPVPIAGLDSFDLDPLFVDPTHGDFRLQSNSPCINAGNNTYRYSWTKDDLGRNPRISGGTVDIGAYEFQNPSSKLSYAWAQEFGLPIDGSADYTDPDADGLNNWQEWKAGTDPTNSASLLKLLSIVPTNNASELVVTWQSVPRKAYVLQYSTNLASPFTTLKTNIVSNGTTKDFVATNSHPQAPVFYRVGVQ